MPVPRVITLAIAVTLSLLSSCEDKSPAEAFLGNAAAVKRGKMIFTGTCGGYCHSFSKGPRDAPYLFDCTWLHGGLDQEIFATITNGVPDTRMVSFAGTMPEGDDDLWRIIAFLKSAREPCS